MYLADVLHSDQDCHDVPFSAGARPRWSQRWFSTCFAMHRAERLRHDMSGPMAQETYKMKTQVGVVGVASCYEVGLAFPAFLLLCLCHFDYMHSLIHAQDHPRERMFVNVGGPPSQWPRFLNFGSEPFYLETSDSRVKKRA